MKLFFDLNLENLLFMHQIIRFVFWLAVITICLVLIMMLWSLWIRFWSDSIIYIIRSALVLISCVCVMLCADILLIKPRFLSELDNYTVYLEDKEVSYPEKLNIDKYKITIDEDNKQVALKEKHNRGIVIKVIYIVPYLRWK